MVADMNTNAETSSDAVWEGLYNKQSYTCVHEKPTGTLLINESNKVLAADV